MQATPTKQHKVRCCIPLSWNFDGWAAWHLGLYFSTGNSISCCDNIYCHSACNSTVQPSTVHTGRFPPLQYNPDTRTSPTNLLLDRKFLLSPFIALCSTILVTLLERHHRQRWNKQKAKLCQQPRQQKSCNHNNSTTGSKPELVHGLGPCRGTAATTAVEGMVSPRLA